MILHYTPNELFLKRLIFVLISILTEGISLTKKLSAKRLNYLVNVR